MIGAAAATTPTTPITTTAPAPPGSNDNGHHHTLQLLDKIGKDIVHVKKAYADLTDYGTGVSKQIEEVSKTFGSLDDLVKQGSDRPEEGPIETYLQEDLIELKKKVMKLKQQIPFKPKARSTSEANPHHPHDSSHGDSIGMRHIASKILDKLPNLCKNEMLVRSSEFKDFKALYNGLDDKQKVCLLCFSAFPEKEIIKKRFMFYWWTGEGFVAPVKDGEQTTEDMANEVFSEPMAKGFIEPFFEMCTLDCLVNKCRVNPFVRAALIALARRAKLFDFDAVGKPIGNFSSSCRACLLAGEKLKGEGIENVHMLFNIDQAILDFEKPELFSLMKNINLL
ncbi:hypothetical protein Vadar_027955 [Vaccinium darrowii]|uniref:Uncharacterized protein n=1 Tax=Vaccinium darrowii TaxID=229202 RepID=A0ACB7YZ38_9ERIC|nr:hypothetical protein Vadar_027955 [Vaccinium darrowii]